MHCVLVVHILLWLLADLVAVCMLIYIPWPLHLLFTYGYTIGHSLCAHVCLLPLILHATAAAAHDAVAIRQCPAKCCCIQWLPVVQ